MSIYKLHRLTVSIYNKLKSSKFIKILKDAEIVKQANTHGIRGQYAPGLQDENKDANGRRNG